MRNIKFSYLIAQAAEHSKLLLFKPFSLKKWLILAFIAYMSGAMGMGSGSGMGPKKNIKTAEAAQDSINIQISHNEEIPADVSNISYNYSRYIDTQYNKAIVKENFRLNAASIQDFTKKIKESFSGAGGAGAFLIITGIFLVIGLVVLFIWLSARFKFIWFESIVKNDASIKTPFKNYEKEGNSLFKFFLILIACFMGLLLLMAACGILIYSGPHFVIALSISIVIFIIAVILFILLGVCIEQFVVPIMALEKCSFVSAWKKFTPILKSNATDIALYFLVLLGLYIASIILSFILFIGVTLAALLCALVIFGAPYLILAVLLKAKIIFYVISLIFFIPFITVFILAIVSVKLPFAVFFRSFSLYYFASLNCGYSPLPLPEIRNKDEGGEQNKPKP